MRLVTRTINDLYFVLSVSGAPLTALAVAKAAALGLGAGVLSAVAPALEAARVEPVEALRRSAFESRARRLLPRVALAGACSPPPAAWSCCWPTRSLRGQLRRPVRDRARGRARRAARDRGRDAPRGPAARGALRHPGPAGRAHRGPLGEPHGRRGRRAGGGRLGRDRRRADDRAASGPPSRTGSTSRCGPTCSSRRRPRAGPARSRRCRPTSRRRWRPCPASPGSRPSAPSTSRARSARSTSASPTRGARGTSRLYRFADGDPAAAWDRVRDGAVIVTEPFAFRHGLPARGASVTLATDRGPRTFPVAGVFYDYATEQGTVFMARNVYERYWDDRGLSSVGAHLAPGASVDEVTRGAARGPLRHGAAGDREPLAAAAGAARVRPHLRGHAVAAAAGGRGRVHRRVERADGAAGRAHARARDARDARARRAPAVGRWRCSRPG